MFIAMRTVRTLRSRLALAVSTVALASALLATSAAAGEIYFADFGTLNPPPVAGSLLRFDTAANALIGSAIKPPAHPSNLVFAPDGKTAYVIEGTPVGGVSELLRVDTQAKSVVGQATPLPKSALDIAISPDGSRLYVVSFALESVAVIDARTGQEIGPPIAVGKGPEEIAITPDGSRAFVTNRDSDNVSVIDTRSSQVVDTITVGDGPFGVAITPDGSRAYVANINAETVSVIDTRTDKAVAGSPITVGNNVEFVAIRPDGKEVYASNFGDDTVSAIDAASNGVIATIGVGGEPTGIAFAPNGKTAYVANLDDGTTSVIDANANATVGQPINIGLQVTRMFTLPDQPPIASFSAPAPVRPGVPVAFDAGASRDPDGAIGRYAWRFGDGAEDSGIGPAQHHTFARPGSYEVSLTLTDNENCSTAFIFTGGSAICNGSGVATATRRITVAYPGVNVRCPAKAKAKGCLFKLQAVTKKRKGKAETRVARIKVRAGKSALVALKPTAKFATRLASARRVLVKRTARIGAAKPVTSFVRLKIVG